MLLASYDMERQRLVYSTSELQTHLRNGEHDIALLHGRDGIAVEAAHLGIAWDGQFDAIDRTGAVFDRYVLDRCQQTQDSAPPTVAFTSPAAGVFRK